MGGVLNDGVHLSDAFTIMLLVCTVPLRFVGLADQGKDIVFRFIIIEYSSLRDFDP